MSYFYEQNEEEIKRKCRERERERERGRSKSGKQKHVNKRRRVRGRASSLYTALISLMGCWPLSRWDVSSGQRDKRRLIRQASSGPFWLLRQNILHTLASLLYTTFEMTKCNSERERSQAKIRIMPGVSNFLCFAGYAFFQENASFGKHVTFL